MSKFDEVVEKGYKMIGEADGMAKTGTGNPVDMFYNAFTNYLQAHQGNATKAVADLMQKVNTSNDPNAKKFLQNFGVTLSQNLAQKPPVTQQSNTPQATTGTQPATNTQPQKSTVGGAYGTNTQIGANV